MALRIALEDSIRSFDPRQSVDANSQYVEDLIHCSLMSFDQDGQPIPRVALAMPRWLDPLRLEVTLKPQLKFSDGSRVTAFDAAATYQSLLEERSFARSGAFAGVAQVEAKDATTLQFKLKEADASFVTNLVVGILPLKVAALKALDPLEIPTCGPYKLKSIDINTITLDRNPHYPPQDAAKMETIELKIVKNEKTRFFKLRTGEIDIVQNSISRDTVQGLEKRNPELRVIRRAALKTTYLGFNVRDKIVGDVAVRNAIALAIDRQEIIDYILAGMATPAATLLPATSPYYDGTLKQKGLDLAGANALLDRAGYPRKGGYRFELSFKTTTDITRVSVAKAIASQLKKIGIKVVVETLEWGRFKQDVDAGRVQLWSLTWIGFKDPDIYRHAFATDSFPPNGGNRGWYSNPRLDLLLKKGRTTSEEPQRKEIYKEIQQIIDKDLPYVFLWHEDNFAVINRDIKDFSLFADGRYSSLTKATID